MKLGSININSIKLGSTQVNKVLLGTVLIWPDSNPNTTPQLSIENVSTTGFDYNLTA